MEKISRRKLKSAMINAGLGVTALSKAAGITQCLVSKFLKDDYSTVQLPTITKLSRALNVPADDLILEGV